MSELMDAQLYKLAAQMLPDTLEIVAGALAWKCDDMQVGPAPLRKADGQRIVLRVRDLEMDRVAYLIEEALDADECALYASRINMTRARCTPADKHSFHVSWRMRIFELAMVKMLSFDYVESVEFEEFEEPANTDPAQYGFNVARAKRKAAK